jgi:hypothetical protein
MKKTREIEKVGCRSTGWVLPSWKIKIMNCFQMTEKHLI